MKRRPFTNLLKPADCFRTVFSGVAVLLAVRALVDGGGAGWGAFWCVLEKIPTTTTTGFTAEARRTP